MTIPVFLIVANFSIVVPAALVLVKVRSDVKSFIPFIAYIVFGVANDVVGFFYVSTGRSNMYFSNIYTLCAFFLLLGQFLIWIKRPVHQYLTLASIGIVVWFSDNLIIHRLSDNNSIFRLFYSLVIVLLSMSVFNRLIIYERNPLVRNPVFMICTGFILYFGCKAFLESFNLVNTGFSIAFYRRLFIILSIVNLLANLFYAYAILCIPKKQEFSLPY